MREPGRNERCWCGSGRKYKHCHLRVRREPIVPLSEVVRDHRRLRSTKHCYHPLAGPAECAGPVVAAHTVPRAALRLIAESGGVYEWLPRRNFGGFISRPGPPWPSRVGIGKASTLHLFCQKHDSALFQAIEQGSWRVSVQTALLCGFRALAYELHAKKVGLSWPNVLRKTQRGRSFVEQVNLEEIARDFQEGTRIALSSLSKLKERWDQTLLLDDYSSVRYYAVVTDRTPDFLLSGFFWPSVDFSANVIRSDPSHLEWTSVSVLPYGAGGIVLLAWLDRPGGHCATFARSLDSLADGEVPHAVTRMAFEFFENVFIRPSWWDGLADALQQTLMSRGRQASSHTGDCLTDDGVRAVDWKVTSRVRMA